jgi:hypothetical protein
VLAAGLGVFALLQSLVIAVLATAPHELHTTQAAATWVLTAAWADKCRGLWRAGTCSSKSVTAR